MYKTSVGVIYDIEIGDDGAVLVLFNHNETIRLGGFDSIRAVLEYVDDWQCWEDWKGIYGTR